jgi:hypothetical protein
MVEDEDVGLDVVRGIFKLLMIDGEWSSFDERGFDWWGYNLRQRIWATPGFNDDGILIFRVYVVSDAVCDVRKSEIDADRFLSNLGMLATGAAWIFDPATRSVKLWSAMTVHEGTVEWVTRVLGGFAILQAIEASDRAEIVAKMVGGDVDISAHPTSGVRAEPDDMLNVLDDVFRPRGQEPSAWLESEELEQICKTLNQSNCVSMGDENGLSAEFAFGETETSLLKVTAEEDNPWIGSGVGIFLQLPNWASTEEASRLAVAFNRAEAFDGRSSYNKLPGYFAGSWCHKDIGEQSMPAFATFIPSAFYQPQLLTNFIYSAAGRAVWAGSRINPIEEPADVKELIAKRFGFLGSQNEE